MVKEFKQRIRRLVNWFLVAANQHQIVRLANSKKHILLTPISPIRGGGSVDRYYHFIFDLALPLYLIQRNTEPDVYLYVKRPGLFTESLLQIFPNNIKVIDSDGEADVHGTENLIGMNPKCVRIHSGSLEIFQQDTFSKLDIDTRDKPNKILLIQRMLPDSYFLSKDNINILGGGASWRSIINHEELHSVIASMVNSPYEFHNLQLEKLSFREQVYYFSRAAVVIAQHGAGLTNCLWMRQKTAVVELSHDETLNHYRILSQPLNLNYSCFKTDSAHATVDTTTFSDWLLSRLKVGQYFNEPTVSSNQPDIKV